MIDHASVCRGDLTCPRCGRSMCGGCVTKDSKNQLPHNAGHDGECLICSGMYKEEDIALWPIRDIEISTRSNKPYFRFIRLDRG